VHELGSPGEQGEGVFDRFERGGFVTRSGAEGEGWLPACDPGSVKLRELVEVLEEGGRRRVPLSLPRAAGAGDRAVAAHLAALDEGLAAASGERTLGQLIDEVAGVTTSAGRTRASGQ